MSDTTTDEPAPPGDPLPLLSDADVIARARGVITGELLLCDLNDPDWQMSMMLLLTAYKDGPPPNMSTLFTVPLAPHAHGHWLNGRVPGLTMKAEAIPLENCEAFVAQLDAFWKALNPES